MKKTFRLFDYLIILNILLLVLITVIGVISFRVGHEFTVINAYGHEVALFGYGIYAYDSLFKAPILMGSDLAMLGIVVPLLVVGLIQDFKRRTLKTRLFLVALLGVVFYYAASISFGVTYNTLVLAYIALFMVSWMALAIAIRSLDVKKLHESNSWPLPSKGVSWFLIVSGIALGTIWLMDILPTMLNHTTLPLIEVYTTEITYVLDIGIISPLMFICYFCLKKKDGLGEILFATLLTLCVIIGLMLPIQTIYQGLAGIVVPIPVLIVKVGVFMLLALFAAYFDFMLFKHLSDTEL